MPKRKDLKSATTLRTKCNGELATGWNTWDTRSALTHVLLPYGAAIDLHVIDGKGIRKNSFTIGSGLLHAGPHTYDGKYTDISLRWNDQKLRIESSADSLENHYSNYSFRRK